MGIDTSLTLWRNKLAQYFKWKCNKCDLEFTSFGPQECDVKLEDNRKVIKSLPHPTTDIAMGLFMHGYCENCRQVKDTIIVEYIKPSDPFEVSKTNIVWKYLKNYSEWIKNNPNKKTVYTECFNYDSVICPTCSTQLVVFPFNKSFVCPECDNGNVEMISEYMS